MNPSMLRSMAVITWVATAIVVLLALVFPNPLGWLCAFAAVAASVAMAFLLAAAKRKQPPPTP